MHHKYKEIFDINSVGADVHCSTLGNGRVINFTKGLESPVSVWFKCNMCALYTRSGKQSENDLHPILSFGHKENYIFEQGKQSFKYVPFVIGDKSAWCWVGDDIKEVVEQKKRRKVIASDLEGYLATSWGANCNESTEVACWRYAMECTK